MAGEFSTKALGEICRFGGGAGFPQHLQGASTGEFPFIKVSDMELPGNSFRITKANNWVDEATRRELRAKAHPANSTVFAKIGIALTYNRRRLLTRPTIVDNNMMAAIPDETQVDPLFFYYLLKKTDFNEVVAGTALPYINASDLAKMEVEVPPLAEQKAIAAVLGALDDKIELNRRMNATLEAMARALFNSWFVDFEPVRAKLDGRQPTGLDPATATLFPDHLDDSPLGHIPKGWTVATLDVIASVGSGKRPVGRNDTLSAECNIPLYGGGGRMGYVPSALYEKPILFTGRVGTLGLIFRTAEPSWPSDNTLIVEPHDPFFDFTYFVLKRFDLITLNRGSTQPLLTQTDLKSQRFVLPPAAIVKAYANFAAPIFEQITANENECRTIATLRDTLLPKLLSGEIQAAKVS